jgi:hypothetical protein
MPLFLDQSDGPKLGDKGFEQKKEGEKNNNIALSSKFVLKFL